MFGEMEAREDERREALIAEKRKEAEMQQMEKKAKRDALMPMYRGLPDYVELNEKRYNFYEDPKRSQDLV